MQGTFTQFVKKNEQESKKDNLAIKILDMCNYIYSQNKSMPPESLLQTAIQEVEKMEIDEVQRKIEAVKLLCQELVIQKFPQIDLINKDINLEVKK